MNKKQFHFRWLRGKIGKMSALWVLAALLPVLLLRDYTPANELRYLSIADEAMRDGTFFTFANHGVPYADKPPLYFWIIMAGKWLLGEHCMFFLSLFSLLPALAVVAVMDRWAARELAADYRPVARLLLLTCGLFLGAAVTLRMDMLMCMFIVLSLRAFYRLYSGEGNSWREAWLFPVYVFLAVFSKGPLGMLIPFFITLVFLAATGRIRTFGRYWGWRTWSVLLACLVLWFGAVYAEGGSDYLNNLLFHQTIDRAVHSFRHGKPFYYYGMAVWYSLAPWSLLLVGAVVAAVWKKEICTDLRRFFLTAAGVTFVLLSLVNSKMEIYLLPLCPFLVYLAAIVLPRYGRSQWALVATAFPALLFALALPCLRIAVSCYGCFAWDHGAIYVAAAVLTMGGVYAFYCLFGGGRIERAVQALSIGLLCALFVGGWALPCLNSDMGYGQLCAKAQEAACSCGASDFYAWKLYRSENMDVYLGREVRTIVREEELLSDRLRGGLLLVRKKELKRFSGKTTWVVGPYAVIQL